jgi:hypothetical protein
MSTELARRVADAVLLEGYVLYPYRASAQKNQARWQFGVLAPPGADEASSNQTECLVEADTGGRIEIVLRFLQAQTRSGDIPWDEGVLREVTVSVPLAEAETEVVYPFAFEGGTEHSGTVSRERWPLNGSIRVLATPIVGPHGLVKLRIRVVNESACAEESRQRPQMLRHSLIAVHCLLSAVSAEFVSMLEPPEWASVAVAECANLGTWPVLVGPGRNDLMLSSPVILYDYPEIAPESAGDMCDATEMDEMLVLRTLTLTDAEKAEARDTDALAAGIIDQIEGLPPELVERLHGTIRYLRKVGEPGPLGTVMGKLEEPAAPWWDPGADSSVSPESDEAEVAGGRVSRGGRVRLRPREKGTDAQDMFLRDRIGVVQAVVSDVDGSTHIAVVLEDDPAAEFHSWYGRFLYFLPEEVELAEPADQPLTQPAGQLKERI